MTDDRIKELANKWCLHPTDNAWDEVMGFAYDLIAEEREACAKVCDTEAKRSRWNWENDLIKNQTFWNGGEQLASNCAAAIRARGEA